MQLTQHMIIPFTTILASANYITVLLEITTVLQNLVGAELTLVIQIAGIGCYDAADCYSSNKTAGVVGKIVIDAYYGFACGKCANPAGWLQYQIIIVGTTYPNYLYDIIYSSIGSAGLTSRAYATCMTSFTVA